MGTPLWIYLLGPFYICLSRWRSKVLCMTLIQLFIKFTKFQFNKNAEVSQVYLTLGAHLNTFESLGYIWTLERDNQLATYLKKYFKLKELNLHHSSTENHQDLNKQDNQMIDLSTFAGSVFESLMCIVLISWVMLGWQSTQILTWYLCS